MLTKKKLHQWLNIALIVGTVACAVAVALLTGPSVGEKALLIAGYAGALKAALPALKKTADEAIDGADLPEDEPVQPFPGPGAMPTDGPGEAK